jgi:hypothetical protein
VRTVEDLQDELERMGRSREGVGRGDDPATPRADGMSLVTPGADGRWRTSVWERGKESDEQVYSTEAEAVTALAARVLRPPPSGPRMSDEERRAMNRHEQEKARAELRRMREDRERRDG